MSNKHLLDAWRWWMICITFVATKVELKRKPKKVEEQCKDLFQGEKRLVQKTVQRGEENISWSGRKNVCAVFVQGKVGTETRGLQIKMISSKTSRTNYNKIIFTTLGFKNGKRACSLIFFIGECLKNEGSAAREQRLPVQVRKRVQHVWNSRILAKKSTVEVLDLEHTSQERKCVCVWWIVPEDGLARYVGRNGPARFILEVSIGGQLGW